MMGSLSIGHWLIVLAIVLLVFGTKRLGSMGGDLGKAIRGFKEGVNGKENEAKLPVESSFNKTDQSAAS